MRYPSEPPTLCAVPPIAPDGQQHPCPGAHGLRIRWAAAMPDDLRRAIRQGEGGGRRFPGG